MQRIEENELYKRGYEAGYRKAIAHIEHKIQWMHNVAPRLRWGLCEHDYKWNADSTAECTKCGAITSAR